MIMEVLSFIGSGLSILLFAYLAICTLYLASMAVGGVLLPIWKRKEAQDLKPIAVLIPCYKDDRVILQTASSAAAHNYPSELFQVIVIADHLQERTLAQLSAIPNVRVLEVQFDVSTKAKSMHTALQQIDPNQYPITMVLDADNLLSEGCLYEVSAAFTAGFQAIQCHRTAKNEDTPVALLDGISEEINNNLFRAGQRFIGHPAAIIGSGMAFATSLIRDILSLPSIHDNPGEDREIDVELLRRGIDIAFLKGVYVYDEKVPSTEVFQKQRVRWLEAQITHMKLLLGPSFKAYRTNPIYLNKLFQTFLLPRLLFIGVYGILFVLLVASVIFGWQAAWTPPAFAWWGLMVIYFGSLILSVPARFANGKTLQALAQIPQLLLAMIKSILQMKMGRKEFIHTPKG